MDTPQSILQSTIVAINQYCSHKIERNFDFLQRQIDALISKTSRGHSLKFFNCGEVLPSECLTCLVNLISDPGLKHTLLLKCLLLFNNLVCDSSIRENLHEKFQLTPALALVIKYHGPSNSDTLAAEALHLLQKVTYGHRVSFEESYMEDLVKFLLGQICSPSTGLTKPAMGVLVNLTRDNFSVQAFIKNYENMQDFSRKLTKLLGDENPVVILFSLTLMVGLCLQEKIANKFWNDTNAPKTFQMIFNILIDGDAGETRRYAVDLLTDVLRVERLQRSLAGYEYLGSCLEQTLSLLTTSSPDSVIKVFELLRTLCGVGSIKLLLCKCLMATFPIQDGAQLASLSSLPLSKIPDPLLATVHWAGQSPESHGSAPLGALDLLTEVYEELVFSHNKVHHEKHAAALLPTALHVLKCPLDGSNLVIQRKLTAMVKAVKLLRSLCNDETLLTITSKRLDSALIARLMHHQFQHNTVALKTRRSPPSDDWSSAGVDLILYLLDLISILKNQELEDLFIATMQETNVVPFLACGMCSGKRQRVQDTVALVCLSSRLAGFPVILLGDTMAAMNADKEMRLSNVTQYSSFPAGSLGTEDKENLHWSCRSTPRVLEQSSCGSINSMDVSEESIQRIIEKMDSGMKPADMKSPEIIAIYERSLHSLQTKEQQLQDLLEAKTLALTQADRMLAQYRSRKGQDEAEVNRLRTLLLSAEKCNAVFDKESAEMKTRLDQYVGEIEELNEENQKLKQVAQMHQELTAAHTDLTDRYESVSKAHQTVSQEHQSLTEMHEMLQKHNANLKQQYDHTMEQLNTLQEERRKVAAQLRKTEEKLEDMTKSSLKWEYDYKRSEEERETMDMCIDKLRSDMAKLEQKKKQLIEKVNQLEFKGSQGEQRIAALEDEIHELKSEVSKHRQIAALINSLSSGEQSEVSVPTASSAGGSKKGE